MPILAYANEGHVKITPIPILDPLGDEYHVPGTCDDEAIELFRRADRETREAAAAQERSERDERNRLVRFGAPPVVEAEPPRAWSLKNCPQLGGDFGEEYGTE